LGFKDNTILNEVLVAWVFKDNTVLNKGFVYWQLAIFKDKK
jgi:hypothetical protein